MPGPIAQREESLARPRSRKGGDQQEVKVGQAKPTFIPKPDENWHPIARMVWDSLEASGQSDFYQQSDWAFAYSLCDDLSAYKEGGRYHKETGEFMPYRSPEMLKAIQSAMTSLLMTEGDRRRVRIELTQAEPEQDPAAVLMLADYKSALDNPPPQEPDSA